MNFKVIAAAAALLASQSFAIIGLGFHYAPRFGNTMDAAPGFERVTDGVEFTHAGFDGMMQGFGAKLWIDLLPIIDIEGTFNIQFGSYDAALYVEQTDTMIPLEIELGGTPFGKANPKFVAMTGDISITYPITDLPIVRPYIGGGVSIHANSFMLNQKFVSGLIDDPAIADVINTVAELQAAGGDPSKLDPAKYQGMDAEQLKAKLEGKLNSLGDTMKQKVQDQALNEGLKTSIGGHALVGARFKLPIIPIAAYVNGKFYFGGDYPDEFDPGIFTLEAGVGLAL